MQNYINAFDKLFDRAWLKEHILNLYRFERRQTFPYYDKAADYVYNLLRAEGFESEKINIPADGKTVFQDKRMPIGWDVSSMKLTLISDVPGIKDPVISDYNKEPLMAVKHSVSTPKGGITARLVTENQMKAGEDVRGAFVLLNQSSHPRGKIIEMLLDLGAYGWVSDYSENPMESPDTVAWANFATETHAWHTQSNEREYISYNITPKTGHYLRCACENGVVVVHAESDGRRYEADFPVITGILRGESEKEVWIIAHMYEPLIDDNANGVIGSVAILKALRDLAAAGEIQLKYSVRVVFAGEMYGFAAASEYFGGNLSKRAIGGINIDAIPASKEKGKFRELRAREAPDYPGFAGNILLHSVCDDFEAARADAKIVRENHVLGDDCNLGDRTIGLPVVWFLRGTYNCFHHNSVLDENYLDTEVLAYTLAASAEWVRKMAALTDDEVRKLLPKALERAQKLLDFAAKDIVREECDAKKRMKFLYFREQSRIKSLLLWSSIPEIEETAGALKCPKAENDRKLNSKEKRPFWAAASLRSWYDYSRDFVFSRIGRGFPHDQVNVPLSMRRELPGYILYSDISELLSRMDGEKSFKELIDELEWDKNIILDESVIRKFLYTCIHLAEIGYLGMQVKNAMTKEDITESLEGLGVKKGDVILVHSSLSGLGYIPGGVETVLDSLKDAVGKYGTILAPAFCRPYIMFEGEVNKTLRFRPYDKRPNGNMRDKTISTGALPKAMLHEEAAFRSGHATHEWVAIGNGAKEMVSGHGFLDEPTGVSSPLDKALKKKAVVLFLGCEISANTFLHYLEEISTNIPKPAVIKYIDEKGGLSTGLIARHLPGDRDFYHIPDSKFYKEAVKRGLKIYTQPCGIGTIYRMELANLYEIGMEMIKEKPDATVMGM